MKISVITPSYNQAQFIERTLDSVVAQAGADYEHFVFDALSDDGSHEIIARYAERNPRAIYRREADRGQMHAINKGLAEASGEILAWINSDDYFACPDAFAEVVREFEAHPEVDVIYGRGHRVDATGKKLSEAYIHPAGTDLSVALQHSLGILQPSLFFRRRVYEAVGGLDERYNLQLDYEYWIRMVQAGFRFRRLDKHLSNATVHENAKSTGQRMAQLNECIALVKAKFGYVPMQWISRYAEFNLTRLDPKVTKGIMLDDSQRERKATLELTLATRFNTDAKAQEVMATSIAAPVVEARRYLEASGLLPRRRRVVVSSFDSQYFNQGLNLIASLHRTSMDTVDEIIVYSLGLSEAEIEVLNSLENVRVVHYPEEATAIFPGYLEPKHRAYKPMAIRTSPEYVQAGDLVLWMDAGLSALDDVRRVFDLVQSGDFFIADHDDKSSWPFYNVNFMHPSAQDAFSPSNEELIGPHYCSCLVGYKVGGKFQRLIDEAFEFGSRQEIVIWPKNIPKDEKYKPTLNAEQIRLRDQLLARPADANQLDRQAVRELFPYYGHRTQAIYSILVNRHGAPSYSGKVFRRSNDLSSVAASVNWQAKAKDTDQVSSRVNLQGQDESVVIYHHRGVYNNLNGLRYKRKSDHLFLLANGPSLRNAPFDELRKQATLGMNAAYRFWDERDFYPTYYCCLDTVVMESHKEEIRRLILESGSNGIRKFFLRQEFLDHYPEFASRPNVLILEQVARSNNLLALDKITTGSFSLLFGIMLGYRNIHLMGVDLNYVEKLPEAEVNGRILEISEDLVDNPNYFFAGYQKKGDRYNPPNRHPNMHVRSWQNIKDTLGNFPVKVLNLNPESALRCFEFDDVHRVLKSLNAPFSEVELQSQAALQKQAEKTFWRKQLLRDLQQCESAVAERAQHSLASSMPLASGSLPSSAADVCSTEICFTDLTSGAGCFPLGEGRWRCSAADGGGRARLIAHFDVKGPTANRSFVAHVRLQADRPLSVVVSLARRGNENYEGTRRRLKLDQPCSVKLSKDFTGNHTKLKLEIELVELDEPVELQLTSLLLVETLGSAKRNAGAQVPALAKANRLYREGRYAAAMTAYLLLHEEQHKLGIYSRNALMCARKLSIASVDTIDQLIDHCR